MFHQKSVFSTIQAQCFIFKCTSKKNKLIHNNKLSWQNWSYFLASTKSRKSRIFWLQRKKTSLWSVYHTKFAYIKIYAHLIRHNRKNIRNCESSTLNLSEKRCWQVFAVNWVKHFFSLLKTNTRQEPRQEFYPKTFSNTEIYD